jgi:hypothetical protein
MVVLQQPIQSLEMQGVHLFSILIQPLVVVVVVPVVV